MDKSTKPWEELSAVERAQRVIEELDRCEIEYSFGPGGIQFDGFTAKSNTLGDITTEEKSHPYIDEYGVHIKNDDAVIRYMCSPLLIIQDQSLGDADKKTKETDGHFLTIMQNPQGQ